MLKEKVITEALAQLDSREMFAKWIWVSIRSFYGLSFPEKNNDHICLLIEGKNLESPVDALTYVYRKYVPNTKQLMFRQSIGDVLQEYGNDKDAPISAFQDLIYLLTTVRAIESLSTLLPTVGNGLLGKRHPDLLYETVVVLRSFAPSPQVYEVVSDLVKSANFDDGYLLGVIEILIECEPSRTPDIINSLNHRLVKLKQVVENLDNGEEWTEFCKATKDCARYISASGHTVVADAILRLIVK